MSSIIYPTTNFKNTETLLLDRGEGVYVYDNKGKKYIEGMAGLWCTALGYGNQELIEAASQQMGQLSYSHLFGGKSHSMAMELSEKIANMLPMDNPKMFFGNSGSDANDSLIKMIRYYFNAIGKPNKKKIICRERSYHGVTMASACLTGLEINHTHFDLPFDAIGVLRTDAPHYYRGALPGESERQFVDRIVDNLERLILLEGADNIAAFIVEPITGASGVIVPPEGYYEKVQAILKKYNIMFWADEVITGFGRTGEDFGSTTMNIVCPDIMTLAKQLSSAYVPISAAVISGDMYEAMIEPSAKNGVFGHGYTYSGHPLGCAVALKTLEIYQRDNLFAHARLIGEHLQAHLSTLSLHPLVGEARGKGLLGALELVSNPQGGDTVSNAKIANFMLQSCQNKGLILRVVAGNVLAFCPPIIIDAKQVDQMLDIVALALEETLAFAVKNRLVTENLG